MRALAFLLWVASAQAQTTLNTDLTFWTGDFDGLEEIGFGIGLGGII